MARAPIPLPKEAEGVSRGFNGFMPSRPGKSGEGGDAGGYVKDANFIVPGRIAP